MENPKRKQGLTQRLNSPTPKWFKKIIAICITLMGAGVAMLAAEKEIPNFVLPPFLHSVAQWFIVAGFVGSAIAKTAKPGE